MKIALILPRAGLYRYGTGAFARYLRYAPLTLTTLAALVPPELQATVTIYDEGVERVHKETIDADLVGITSITGASGRAYAYADYFRTRGVTVVIGGVHATLLPAEAQQHADAVVTGPAYTTWPQLLRDFAAGQLKSLYEAPERIDFSCIPKAAARHKLHKRRYFTIDSIQAVFGCPNVCEFCVTPYVCKGYQHRPIADVIAEIRQLKGKYMAFVDPSPIEDIDYAIELCHAMKPLKKQWTSLATTRLLQSPQLMNAMSDAGCRGLLIGFESLSQHSNNKAAKAFNKVGDYYRLVKELHARGIAIMGCFVHGLDEDDRDCFKRTLEFVDQACIDLPRFTICTPFPGTKFFARLKAEGRILTEKWTLYDAQHAVFRPRNMTVEELEGGHAWIWDQAYRWSGIARRLIGSRSFLQVTLLTNLGYRRYAKAIPHYHARRMLEEEII
jgi:radical SAM superfamily enzyme YgiQ (UPF0313 family)